MHAIESTQSSWATIYFKHVLYEYVLAPSQSVWISQPTATTERSSTQPGRSISFITKNKYENKHCDICSNENDILAHEIARFHRKSSLRLFDLGQQSCMYSCKSKQSNATFIVRIRKIANTLHQRARLFAHCLWLSWRHKRTSAKKN